MRKIEMRVRIVMGKILGIEGLTIPADASQKTFLKWDSLMHMNLMLALEDEFCFEFTDKEIADIKKLSSLIKCVEEKTA